MPVQLIAWNCAEKVTAEEHELGWAEAQLVLFPSFQHSHNERSTTETGLYTAHRNSGYGLACLKHRPRHLN